MLRTDACNDLPASISKLGFQYQGPKIGSASPQLFSCVKVKPRLTARGLTHRSTIDPSSTRCPSKINLDDSNRVLPRIQRPRLPSIKAITSLVLPSSCERPETHHPAAVPTEMSKGRPSEWILRMESAAQLYISMIEATRIMESTSLADLAQT